MKLEKIIGLDSGAGTVQTGLLLQEPPLFIPFGIDATHLLELLGDTRSEKVSDAQYSIQANPLGGFCCLVNFFFAEEKPKLLSLLQLCRNAEYYNTHTLQQSYQEFQKYLRLNFGSPMLETDAGNGFLNCVWELGDVVVRYTISSCAGLAERVEIFRIPAKKKRVEVE